MQFNRQASIVIGEREFESSKFDFEFEVDFDDSSDLNHAEVLIYNLSNDTVNSIKTETPLIINAGYEGDVGGIFVGAIYDADTKRNGVDRETTILAVDAGKQRNKLRISRSYKKGIRASQIIGDLTSYVGLSIGALKLPDDKQYRNGKNLNGKVLTLLKQIAKDCGATFKINKGMAYFRKKGEGQDISFIFNSDTGLIGAPEPFVEEEEIEEKGKKKKKTKEIKGFNVKTLLNHRVQPNHIIGIESSTADGNYRVRSGKHIYSDTEMISDMEVV